jgi:hypothetical protein
MIRKGVTIESVVTSEDGLRLPLHYQANRSSLTFPQRSSNAALALRCRSRTLGKAVTRSPLAQVESPIVCTFCLRSYLTFWNDAIVQKGL